VGRSEKRFTWCFVAEERTLILTISGKFFTERISSLSSAEKKKIGGHRLKHRKV
jgi:hypothetical protein